MWNVSDFVKPINYILFMKFCARKLQRGLPLGDIGKILKVQMLIYESILQASYHTGYIVGYSFSLFKQIYLVNMYVV